MDKPPIIRSYVLRQGRITEAQKRFLQTHAQQYVVKTQCELTTINQTNKPLYIEIGFGYGEATAIIAKANPNYHYLAFDVHTPGVGALVKKLVEEDINNVTIAHMDAMLAISKEIPTASISGFHIFFPDPWRKSRHHKRRLIRPSFIQEMADKLKDNAYILCVTDWQNYAEQITEVFANNDCFYQITAQQTPLTNYENKAKAAGRAIHRLCYTRQSRNFS